MQRLGFDRHTQHRESGFGGAHAREMSGASRAGNDNLDATTRCGGGVFEEQIGGPVGRDHLRFIRHLQLGQLRGRVLQGVPIGLAAHDDAHQWIGSRRNHAAT